MDSFGLASAEFCEWFDDMGKYLHGVKALKTNEKL